MDRLTDGQTDRQMDGNMDGGQTSGYSPLCCTGDWPFRAAVQKAWKDNSVNNIEVLRLLRTVGMDGWGWMDIDGPVCGWRGPIWSLKGLRGQIYSLSQLIWDLGRLTRLVRADLSPAGADLRFGRALKVTKSCRIQVSLGFIGLVAGGRSDGVDLRPVWAWFRAWVG